MVQTWQRYLRWNVHTCLRFSSSRSYQCRCVGVPRITLQRRSLVKDARCCRGLDLLRGVCSRRFPSQANWFPTAGMPARCARHLAAGHAQHCSEACLCAVRVPVTQRSRQSKEFPRGPLHRLLSRRRPLRQSREQILRPLLKLRARRRLSKTGEPSGSSRGRRRSTLTRR
jgi:hypothetical protein